MKKILVAVDGSPASLHAAKMALEIAKATGSVLTVAYSVPPIALPGEVPFTVINEVIKADTARGQHVLEDVLKEANGDFAVVERQQLRTS